jgi:quercetin dioxygenase-like cupin family protein
MGARRISLITVAATTLLGVAGWAGSRWAPRAATAAPIPIAQRIELGETLRPAGASGGELGLTRVVIPPGASLSLHRHAGTQVSYVQAGVLTYTVRNGGVQVRRGQASSRPLRSIGPGQTATMAAGTWIVEQASDIHRAANRGTRPVVVLLATLRPVGSPPSIPVR